MLGNRPHATRQLKDVMLKKGLWIPGEAKITANNEKTLPMEPPRAWFRTDCVITIAWPTRQERDLCTIVEQLKTPRDRAGNGRRLPQVTY